MVYLKTHISLIGTVKEMEKRYPDYILVSEDDRIRIIRSYPDNVRAQLDELSTYLINPDRCDYEEVIGCTGYYHHNQAYLIRLLPGSDQ